MRFRPSRRTVVRALSGAGGIAAGLHLTGLYDLNRLKGCPPGRDPNWHREFFRPAVARPDRDGGDSIYITSHGLSNGAVTKGLYRVAADSGEDRWHFETRAAPTTPPRVGQDYVYVASHETGVSAIDAASGDLAWQRDIVSHGGLTTNPGPTPVLLGSGLVVRFAPTEPHSHGHLSLLDAETGETVWTTELEGPILDVAPMDGDLGVFSEQDGPYGVQRVRATDGEVKWNRTPVDPFRTAVFGDSTAALWRPDDFTVLDSSTGQKRWERNPGGDGRPIRSLALDPEREQVVVGMDSGNVVAYDVTTGTRKWQTRIYPGDVPSSEQSLVAIEDLTIRDSTVWIVTGARRVGALDATDGSLRGRAFLTGTRHYGYKERIRCAASPSVASIDVGRVDLYTVESRGGVGRFERPVF